MVRHAVLAALLTLPAAAAQAQAPQTPADLMATARTQAANQLGVLEYCQTKGFAGDDAVTAQREAVARVPGAGASGGSGATDAEALGRSGTMLVGQERMTLAQLAEAHHVEVSAMCRQMADSAVMVSSALKSNGTAAGGIPGLPAMSGMPTVPGMPAMPATPGMPAMPAMPGVAPAK